MLPNISPQKRSIKENPMARTGITYQDIVTAAAALQGMQKNITVDNIREVLGTGSKSTIARFLKAWKEQNGISHPDEDHIPTDLLAMVKGLWQHLQDKATLQINQYHATANEKIQNAEQNYHAAEKKYSEIYYSLQKIKSELQQQQQENQLRQNNIIQLEHEKAKLTERNETLKEQLNEQKAENNKLHLLMKHIQSNLEHYQKAIHDQREQQSLALEKQRQEYKQTIHQLLEELDATHKKSQEFETLNTDILNQCQKMQSHLTQLQTKLKNTEENEQRFSAEIATLHTEKQQLLQTLHDLHQTQDQKNTKLVETETRLALLQHQYVQLQQNQPLIEELKAENLNFVKRIAHLEGQLVMLQSQTAYQKVTE